MTSLLNNLETEIKVIAISETWLKPSHINFNMQNYNMDHELRPKKHAGGVALYLHNLLQYKVRNDLIIGSDPESINFIFVEIDKSCVGITHHIIVGCIYRPPWFDLSQFNELLNKTLDLLNKNHYVFLLGDFNVDLTQGVETNLAMEEFKNTFSTHYFYPLINKPTREVTNSKSIIDNIFSNVPYALDMCDVGIISTYISDHHAIFCVLDTVISVPQHNNKQNIIIKRNLCDRNVEHFISYLANETWYIVYEGDAQKAFMWFKGLIDLLFDKCFPKQCRN